VDDRSGAAVYIRKSGSMQVRKELGAQTYGRSLGNAAGILFSSTTAVRTTVSAISERGKALEKDRSSSAQLLRYRAEPPGNVKTGKYVAGHRNLPRWVVTEEGPE
jgi:hypothetical protein